MNETKFMITVKTKEKLTDEDIANIMIDFQNRLQRLWTKGPECLNDADITIKYIKP